MKESINTAIIVGIIITIIGLIELVLFASFAYSRAFKIKSRIVDIIEEEAGYNETVKDKIDSEVAKIGYRLTEYGNNSCPTLEDDSEKYELKLPTDSTFAKVHGDIKLYYVVYKDIKTVMLDKLVPEDILSEGHQSELITYKGVMVSKEHSDKDIFKINLLGLLDNNK